ncbi:MAG: lysylphosphatidylglycerol synthase domain-containing protein [Bacteroidota bacterium]
MSVTKVKKTLNLLIKFAIVIASYGYLYVQIGNRNTLSEGYRIFRASIGSGSFIAGLCAVVILMLVNWALEACKWKYLIRKIESVTFFSAFKAVWAGITVSTFTPNRIGELFGRSFILKKASLWEGTFATITGSLGQLLVTLVAGSFATLFFMEAHPGFILNMSRPWFTSLIFLTVLLNALAIFFFFNIHILTPLLGRLFKKRFIRMQQHIKVFASYSGKELGVVILLSGARYLVFSLQFFMLFRLFSVPIPLVDSFIVTAVIYFIMAAIPTVALSELGVRGSLAIATTAAWSGSSMSDALTAGAGSAAAFIWLINLVIPALVGSIFVFRLRFFRKNES